MKWGAFCGISLLARAREDGGFIVDNLALKTGHIIAARQKPIHRFYAAKPRLEASVSANRPRIPARFGFDPVRYIYNAQSFSLHSLTKSARSPWQY